MLNFSTGGVSRPTWTRAPSSLHSVGKDLLYSQRALPSKVNERRKREGALCSLPNHPVLCWFILCHCLQQLYDKGFLGSQTSDSAFLMLFNNYVTDEYCQNLDYLLGWQLKGFVQWKQGCAAFHGKGKHLKELWEDKLAPSMGLGRGLPSHNKHSIGWPKAIRDVASALTCPLAQNQMAGCVVMCQDWFPTRGRRLVCWFFFR